MAQRFPPLNALRAFDAAAQAGSFKDGAAALNVTQSAISHQIKYLEEYLGAALFRRHARGIELTPAGREFQQHVHAAFREIERGVRRLHQLTRPEELTVQTYSTIALHWLMPRLAGFQKRHPRLAIRLTTAQNDPQFADDAVDIALVIGEHDQPRLEATYLFTPRLFPVCAPQLAAQLKKPEDLADMTLLQVYPSAGDWRRWLAAHGLEAIDPDQGLRFDSYDHALRMAARGHGVALAMQPYAEDDLASGALVRAFPDGDVDAGVGWYLASPELRAQAAPVRAFRQWIVEQVEQDPALAALRRAA